MVNGDGLHVVEDPKIVVTIVTEGENQPMSIEGVCLNQVT